MAKHARDPVLLAVCVRLAAKFADTKLPDPDDMIVPHDLRCEQSNRPLDSETLMECDSHRQTHVTVVASDGERKDGARGAQPPARVLEPVASKVAYSTAFDRPGASSGS